MFIQTNNYRVQTLGMLLLYSKNLRLIAYHCFHNVFKSVDSQILRFHDLSP